MGGQGSGGWNRKYSYTTKDVIKINVSEFKDACVFGFGRTRRLIVVE